MKRIISILVLGSAALLVCPLPANAFGKRPLKCEEKKTKATQTFSVSRVSLLTGGETEITVEDEMVVGASIRISPSSFQIHLGTNLTACLLTKDDGSFLLSKEPDNGAIYSWLEGGLLSDKASSLSFALLGLTATRFADLSVTQCNDGTMTQNILFQTWKLNFPAVTPADSANCPSTVAGAIFDGRTCLREMSKDLRTNDFLNTYFNAIDEMKEMARQIGDIQVEAKVNALAIEVVLLKKLLHTQKKDSFIESGVFYSTNFKNYAPLYCKMASLGSSSKNAPDTSSLLKVLSENDEELMNSIRFLERLAQN